MSSYRKKFANYIYPFEEEKKIILKNYLAKLKSINLELEKQYKENDELINLAKDTKNKLYEIKHDKDILETVLQNKNDELRKSEQEKNDILLKIATNTKTLVKINDEENQNKLYFQNKQKSFFEKINAEFQLAPIENNNINISKYRKMPLSSPTKFNALLGSIPGITNALQGIRSSQLFRLQLPAGKSISDLNFMQHNGGITADYFTSGSQGISGKASFLPGDPLSATSAVVGSVMVVMSQVVGQYYMNEINKNLEKINANIEFIKQFLTDTVFSELDAIELFMKRLIKESSRITDNQLSKQSYYNQVILNEQIVEKDIHLIGKTLIYLENAASDESNEINNTIMQCASWIKAYEIATIMYSQLRILEVFLIPALEDKHYQKIIDDINSKYQLNIDDYGALVDLMNDKISKIDENHMDWARKLFNTGETDEQKRLRLYNKFNSSLINEDYLDARINSFCNVINTFRNQQMEITTYIMDKNGNVYLEEAKN